MANNTTLENEARKVLALLSSTLPGPQTTSQPSTPETTSPTIIGLTGLQGSGKSTWASALVDILQKEYKLRAITVSLDDLYKTHNDLVQLRENDPENKLFRTRGQPGTHDEELAMEFFTAIKKQSSEEYTSKIRIPSFDKSRYGGEGDRAPFSAWPEVLLPIDVVIFEGWCVGFRACPESPIQEKHEASCRLHANATEPSGSASRKSTNTLADHDLRHLLQVNKALGRYCKTFMGPQHFDNFIHLDTDCLENVYDWRLDQEHALKQRTNSGMSDEQVVEFVRGYMPAYELYLDKLREGFFESQSANGQTQVRVCLDRERNVVSCGVVGK